MSIRGQVLAIMNSEAKETFLLAMGHRLGISARDVFAGDAQHGSRQAQACNEMMIAIWSQVWAMKDGAVKGYPDSDFIAILLEKADLGGARLHLRNAIESALVSVGKTGGKDGES
ncbi:hypothetical protein [Streptomyces litchfieldiae]|uniref:Uncharacterized protein n=1 Tax=Streptomyces litchfieldiae TaxID=3075543 RepID=A0ABU2MXF2_9ACTN|nr:hypothetical protein [Streptomyces sp. DSM 44938]MDT0346325.1 hypothetical protein [Streptomyces sp. DSM 44938]